MESSNTQQDGSRSSASQKTVQFLSPNPVQDTKDLSEKIENIKVNPSSATGILVKNSILVPSSVVHVRKLQNVGDSLELASISPSSPFASATGNPRNKTALAPGHSLMDWIRLGSSGVDLTGVGPVPRVVTISELAKHNTANDAWMAIRGIVFNVTRYMDFHPGGIEELMKGVGKDATKIFESVHAWVNYRSILQKCIVGRLSREPSTSENSLFSDRSVLTRITPDISETSSDEELAFGSSSVLYVEMKWKQTTKTITFGFQAVVDYPAANFHLLRLGGSELLLSIHFGNLEKDIVKHTFKLTADVEWPPQWARNYETMEVHFTFTKKTGSLWKSYGIKSTEYKAKSKERLYREYEVVSNSSLCKVVNIIVLRAKDFLELIPIGRHLEVRMKVQGTEVSRMYTPVPPCLHPEDMAPNYTSDCICFMVKQYPDGALSPSMTALQPGEILTLSSGLGTFTIESFDTYSTIHMLAAGTGLTAMLGIIQRSICRRNVVTINLIIFNKKEENIFYYSQLERVSREKKLKVIHVLSQPVQSWSGRRGEICEELLSEMIGYSVPQACVFSCGPEGFMKSAKKLLMDLGWESCQIHEFED